MGHGDQPSPAIVPWGRPPDGAGALGYFRPRGDRGIRITGNTQGLKASQVRALERLYRRRLPAGRLVTQEFARELTEISHEIGREVGVLVDRRGTVTHAMVGGTASIEMPEWGRLRAGQGRLRGLRCIHTYLGDEPVTHDDVTDLAKLRLDAMVTLGFDDAGLPTEAHVAHLRPVATDGTVVERMPPRPPALLDLDFQDWI